MSAVQLVMVGIKVRHSTNLVGQVCGLTLPSVRPA
jgi:hypothetical protein